MAIKPYLAMTAAEFRQAASLPELPAWMACHFSPYSTGLSNLPSRLPEGAVVMVNDITPIHAHDPETILHQLQRCADTVSCTAIVLDFQRKPGDAIRNLTRTLLDALPCPVVVSDLLAEEFDCPVFLSPCPPYRPLEEHIAPWGGREIWLEAARSAARIRLTAQGSRTEEPVLPEAEGFPEAGLHCHYSISASPDEVFFTLWRSDDDLQDLLTEAESLGICNAIGLYQELRSDIISP